MTGIKRIKKYGGLPVVTAAMMKYLDKKATADHGIPEDRLMENAGRAVAEETIRIIRKKPGAGAGAFKAVVCSGKGNNGGDGLVAARRLKAAGAGVRVFLIEAGKSGYGGLVVRNLRKARAAGVRVSGVAGWKDERLAVCFKKADVLLDALLGVSAVGAPSGSVRRMIRLMNKSGRPIIAVDIPSGLNPDTGRRPGVCVAAGHTLTIGFAKAGLLAPGAAKSVGKIKVLNIGYPAALAAEAERAL